MNRSWKSRRLGSSLILAACAALSFVSVASGESTPLKDGDRVVFYGDSITEQRLYTRYLQQYVDCRYPDKNVRFFNAGWGGDTAPGALRRIDRDVMVLKPDVVTLFFGMNDGHYKPFEQSAADDYRAGMEGMIKALKEKDVRVIIYTPGAVDKERQDRLKSIDYNDTLKQLGDVCRDLGKKYHCEVVDVHEPMLSFQSAQQAKDSKFVMIPDGVHPNDTGHLVMAGAMLPALAAPMGTVASVDARDADKGSTGDRITHEGDTWRVFADTGTPFWIDPISLQVARASGVADFVEPKLIVKHLPAGKYQVGVDGANTLEATETELAKGIPLALNTANGKLVHDLIRQKEDVYRLAWREIRLPLGEHEHVDDALDALKKTDDALSDAIHSAAAKRETVQIVIQPMPSGTNLALHKSYTTSDENHYGWGTGGLTDGSWEPTSTTCFATGDTDSFPKTATIDLGSSSSLGQILIGAPDFGSTKNVVVAISEDGKRFKDVGAHEFKQHQIGRATLSFDEAKARYIRLTYPDHYPDEVGYSRTFVFTTEVEAYAPQAKR